MIVSYRTATLSIELCEQIIDVIAEPRSLAHGSTIHLYHDVNALETLRACSLTCRAWTVRAQLHMFRIIGVHCSSAKEKNIDGLLSLLARHKGLRRFSLTVKGGHDEKFSSLHVLPVKLPRHVPDLSQLRIACGAYYAPPGSFSFLRQFASVTTLSLLHVTFYSLSDLRRFVAAFRSLAVLELLFPEWYEDKLPNSTAPAAYALSKSRPRELTITADRKWLLDKRSSYFIRWIAQSQAASCLERLDIRLMMILNESMLAEVSSVIDSSKDTLNYTRLQFGPHIDYSASKLDSAVYTTNDP